MAFFLVVVQIYPVREADTYILLKSNWNVRSLLLRISMMIVTMMITIFVDWAKQSVFRYK